MMANYHTHLVFSLHSWYGYNYGYNHNYLVLIKN